MKTRYLAKIISLGAALTFLASSFACHKKPSLKTHGAEITQKSYPVRVFGYKTSFVAKTTPQNLGRFFINDLSWINKLSSSLQFQAELKPGLDMSVAGSSMNVTIKMMGLSMPAKIVTLKYVPDKELWLMVLTEESWLIARVEAKSVPDGCLVNLSTLGNISPSAAKLVDTLQFAKVAAARIDYAMATVQHEFDPSLDPKQLTEQGLRGELFEKPFQAYEASIWLNVSPEKAVKRALEPENFKKIFETGQVQGVAECLFAPENLTKWELKPGQPQALPEIIHCPDTSIKMAGIKWETDSFAMMSPADYEHPLTMHATLANLFAEVTLFGKPENEGTRVWLRLVLEPPGNMPNLAEVFMALSGIPQWMKNILIDIKTRTEGVG